VLLAQLPKPQGKIEFDLNELGLARTELEEILRVSNTPSCRFELPSLLVFHSVLPDRTLIGAQSLS
jgi:hypothetical protein